MNTIHQILLAYFQACVTGLYTVFDNDYRSSKTRKRLFSSWYNNFEKNDFPDWCILLPKNSSKKEEFITTAKKFFPLVLGLTNSII